jgi:hypothetical protein
MEHKMKPRRTILAFFRRIFVVAMLAALIPAALQAQNFGLPGETACPPPLLPTTTQTSRMVLSGGTITECGGQYQRSAEV